jgi:hypothetical protein
VQYSHEHERDRPGEVEHVPHLGGGQDVGRRAKVGVDVGGAPLRRGGQQRPGVGEYQRIVVDVNDAAARIHRLRHLMHVTCRRQPGADVEELPDAGLRGQVPDGPAEERAVLPRSGAHPGHGRHHLVGHLPVRREVILAAQVVVIQASRMRPGGIDL